ncbi:RNA-directed DNA polymerase from mobile element jockey [Plakobranchus ocellatus]|uniref:RNA-directed DNA polymerase from mobile element jockey n=1 Tax=Plakobranchus ocellatus TaxID=259542 RepID=A0AAV4D5X3_9GAST|nr:RNA-directed DNA polymerase from mobile element jockey [Plakobranchus ocellatus]
MKTILTNKHISIETRKRALQCYIGPVLMYGCEEWTMSKQIQNKLEATEMWFLRRMLRVPWTAKKTNERVLNEANERRSMVRTIRKRQAAFLGHVMRRGKLEHLEEKYKHLGSPAKLLQGLKAKELVNDKEVKYHTDSTWWKTLVINATIRAREDRKRWRVIVANDLQLHTG